MATTVNVTTTYAGEAANEYISAVLQSMSSIEHVRLRTNIRHKEVVKKLADTVALATENCDFTDTGTVTVTERIIEPARLELAREFCKNDHYNDWDASVGVGGFLDGIGDTFQDYLLNYYGAALASVLETKMWQGDAGGSDPFSGFETLLAADGDVNDVTATALTAGNVIAQMTAAWDACPSAVLGASEKPKLYVNQKTARLYRSAMSTLGYAREYHAADIPLEFEGFEIAVCNGMSDDVMVIAQPSNLWVGTADNSEWSSIKLLDMEDQDLSDNVRLRMKYTFGCQHGIGGDIVLYS